MRRIVSHLITYEGERPPIGSHVKGVCGKRVTVGPPSEGAHLFCGKCVANLLKSQAQLIKEYSTLSEQVRQLRHDFPDQISV